ncbi:MAG: hypothetical protein RL545_263 [Actinomycetota bacterium]
MEIKLQKTWVKYLVPVISVSALVVTVGSIAVVAATAPSQEEVLIAARDLPAGATLTVADVKRAQLPLGAIASNYLSNPKQGFVIQQSLTKGQLIPKNDLAPSEEKLFPIRLNNLRPMPKAINVGDRVDIWATKQAQLSTTAPEPVAFAAIVTLIENTNTMAQSTTSVELRVSEEYLESLLAAIDSNSQLSLILHETVADIE